MEKVGTIRGYDLYRGKSAEKTVYNAVPKGMKAPESGYDLETIAQAKNINPLAWTVSKDKLKGKEDYPNKK